MRRNNQDLGEAEHPEQVPVVLRNAAQAMYEAEGELQAAWQDKHAGRVWHELGKVLDACADKAEKVVEKLS